MQAGRRRRWTGRAGSTASVWLGLGAALVAFSGPATPQTKSAAEGIAEYRAQLADGNPAELFEAKGEALWQQKRGPKNASLQGCDL